MISNSWSLLLVENKGILLTRKDSFISLYLQGLNSRSFWSGECCGPSGVKTRLRCYKCRKPGHTARDCPARSYKQEAAGRSASISAAHVVSTVDSSVCYSVEEIKEHLADKKASVETVLMEQASQENAVVQVSSAVGLTPYFNILVESVPVKALVDSGSQLTIVSRSLLHEVAKKLRSQKKNSTQAFSPKDEALWKRWAQRQTSAGHYRSD